MNVTGVGIWSGGLVGSDPAEVTEAAVELDELGYSSLWIPCSGLGTFAAAERLLASTERITVATGVLNVWLYPVDETAAECARIRVAHGDRFLLGLGVNHGELLPHLHGKLRYAQPLAKMEAYLIGLDVALAPVPANRRVVAALGPKMLELARHRAGGAHPYNVTPDHTATARGALGVGKLLVPEQVVALTTDPADGRAWGRAFLEHYLPLSNYTNNLRRLGFGDDDFADGGSDRLVDALIAWGDEDTIARRVQEHLDAGADGVCIQLLSAGSLAGMGDLHREQWRTLAPALTALR
jgi:probable F420-dependent oxidoreductase